MAQKQSEALVKKATDGAIVRVGYMSEFFPMLERGHGHKRGRNAQPPICAAEGCVRKNKHGDLEYSRDHIRGRFAAALTYVLDVESQTREA